MIAILAVLAAPLPAHAETMRLADVVLKSREARLAGDKAAWLAFGRRAHALAPEHPELLFSLARAEAANGNTQAALILLEDAVRRGAGFDLAVAQELSGLRADARFMTIEAKNAANLKPVPNAELFVEFADPALAPEGITFDPASRRFLVGSLRGEIWQVDAERKASLFVKPGSGLREVLGLKVDVARNLLWCVDGVFPDFPPGPAPKPDQGATAVNAFNLADATPHARTVLDERPVQHGLNDLAVARSGDVYITDTEAQTIYRLKSGAAALEKFFAADDLTFVNGIVLAPDEKALYVAHVEGVSAIDLATRKHKRLIIGPDMAVGSIDGLAERDGALIGVQNSPSLARVVRLHVSGDGARVTKLEVLAARGELDLGATTGVVVGDAFYAVASAPPASPSSAASPNPRILRIPLNPAARK
jgi:sugar lactone lactonase YvrE